MDLLVFFTLVGLIVWTVTSAFVFQKNPRNPLNRSFFFLGLSTCVWGAGILLRYTAQDESAARAFFNTAMFGAVMTFSFFFRFALLFIDSAAEDPPSRRTSYVLQSIVFTLGLSMFVVLACSGLGASSFPFKEGHFRVVTGPVFLALVIWGLAIGVFSAGLIVFFKPRMTKPRFIKQANTILVSMVVPVTAIAILELVLKATSQVKFIGEPFFSTVAFGLIIAWGTLRYGLMSVTPETAATQIIESLPESLLLIGPNGSVIAANRTFLETVGMPQSAVVGSQVWNFFMATGDGDPKASRISFSSTRRSDFRLDLVSSSSDKIPVNVTTKPILDDFGDRVGSMMLLRDMRQSQKIEAELVNAEKLASLGQLVAGVAHEINNPMTTVMGLSELGKKKFASESSGSYFSQILEQSVRIKEIVGQLLLFARKSEPRIEKADLLKTLVESADLVRMGLKSVDISLEKRFSQPTVEVVCDPEKLRQVFVNVIKNAFESIQEAGGRGTVTYGAESDGKWARIEVSDDGPGMPPEVLAKIFNPFYTTKEIGKGTGLGLSICLGIVDAHGGKMWAESEVGRGTRMMIEIPVEPMAKPSGESVQVGGEEEERERPLPREAHRLS